MKVPTDLFIDGQYRTPATARRTPLVNPAAEETFAEVAAADAKELDAAAQAAHTAWEKQWRDFTPGKRPGNPFYTSPLVHEHIPENAQLQGLPIWKPNSEPPDAAGTLA